MPQDNMGTEPEPQEDSDIDEEEFPIPVLPPNGGWGWMVVIASLFTNIIVDGVCFSYGIFFIEFLQYYGESNSKTAFVGSLIPGMYLGMGPIASALANKFGFRVVTILGSIIAAVFFFLSTFSPTLDILVFTYGVMGGFGFGLMYLPSIVVVNFYFDSKRALATGIAVAGSGIGTMCFAPLGRYLLDNYDWQGSYIIISAIILNGIVCGAIFRPLEQNRPRRRRDSSREDPDPPRNLIIQRILEEKKRIRTTSTGSLDGSVITNENQLIKDKMIIKNIKMERLEEEVQVKRSTSSLSSAPVDIRTPNGNGALTVEDTSIRPTSGSFSYTGSSPKNKLLDRLRAESVPQNRRVRTISNSSSNSDQQPVWSKQSDFSNSRASLSSIQREALRPMYRKDIFYSGSVCNIKEYQSTSNMGSYVSSITSIPELPDDDDDSCEARCMPIKVVLGEMFDLSPMKSPTFVILCFCNILAMTGFFTPFVYITSNALSMGISVQNATLLITIIGLFNTLGRVVAGWMSDRSWADCLVIHNVSLVIGGSATCLVPVLNSYWMLCVFCAIFGTCIACFIALRSIVLVELLGIEKLTNAFGLLLLFQGIASLIGSPIAGIIYDFTQSYTASFVSSGLLIAIAGILVLPIRRIKEWEEQRGNRCSNQNEKDAASLLTLPIPEVIGDTDEEYDEDQTSM